MSRLTRRAALKIIVASALPLATGIGGAWAAESYPTRPIRVLVPFASGGGLDTLARRIVPFLGEGLGERVFVENKPGGNSILATVATATAPADGYTVLLQMNSLTVNPYMVKDLPYDSERDLTPVTLMARTAHVLVVSNSLPVKSVRELVEYGKANPGKLNFGTGGIGSSNQLAAELFMKATGVKMEHIAYKGSSEFIRDLVPGVIHVGFPGLDQAASLGSQGTVRVLAVTSAKRAAMLPDTPTMAEAGFPFEYYSWMGFFAPAKTPRDIVQKLSRAFHAAAQNPKVRELNAGYELIGSTPEEFADFLRKENAQLGPLLKTLDLTTAAPPPKR